MAKDNHSLEKFEVPGITPVLHGVSEIEVISDIDPNIQKLNMSANDASANKSNKITNTNDKVKLSKQDDERMVNEADRDKVAVENSLEFNADEKKKFLDRCEKTLEWLKKFNYIK
ncbi:heat shock [Brachionus plicatilis]|uniref:Heat shock n=1 Tax=Brachionus plicatilis TaxID=10195 RepID=A0A3M7QMZ8_BRAPC|nr:heat shock [Brachionus plicatilis]